MAIRSTVSLEPRRRSFRLHGFGYALADGTYANPFYGDHFVPPGVYAFFSDPKNRKTSEPLVKFTATIVP